MSILFWTFVTSIKGSRPGDRREVLTREQSDWSATHEGLIFDIMIQNKQENLCERCFWKDTIRPLLNVPFCEHSSTTCTRPKSRCEDYKFQGHKQLELF